MQLFFKISFLSSISLALMSYSLLGAEATIKLKPQGENAEPIVILRSLVEKSKTLHTMLLDLEESGSLDSNLEIPLPLDAQTLEAIFVHVLVELENLSATNFMALKNLVKLRFPESGNAKALVQFTKAALYLDLDELLLPSVALLVDYTPWLQETLGDRANPLSTWRLHIPQVKQRFFKEYPDFPSDLFNFITDYLYSISVLEVGKWPINLIASGDKLYVLHHKSGTISVINSLSNAKGDPIMVEGDPYVLAHHNNKLHVWVEGNDNTLTSKIIIDLDTAHAISTPIALSDFPESLVIYNNKLYGAIGSSKTIVVKDLYDDQAEVPIQLEQEPTCLNIMGNKLYATTKQTTLVLDLTTREVTKALGGGTGRGKSLAIVFNSKLYVNTDKSSIEVIDSTSDEVVKTIPVENGLSAFVINDNKLYYSTCYRDGIFVKDLGTLKDMEPIKLDFVPYHLAVLNNKLYALDMADEGAVSVINLYYFR